MNLEKVESDKGKRRVSQGPHDLSESLPYDIISSGSSKVISILFMDEDVESLEQENKRHIMFIEPRQVETSTVEENGQNVTYSRVVRVGEPHRIVLEPIV
jgi:hypothetical protein